MSNFPNFRILSLFSPLMSPEVISSSTRQPTFLIIPALIIHRSIQTFTPGSKPTFSTNPSQRQTSFTYWTAFVIMGLDYAHRFTFIILFIPCGILSWLPVSFLLHVKYTLDYRIIPMTSLQPSGYIAECFWSLHVVVEGPKRNLPVGFSCNF